MQTQRDRVQAHQFLMGRMTSALVLSDPSSSEVPARRAMSGLIFGMVLALLIGVGFGIYGLLVPGGNQSWRAANAIVVEKETGTRYVNVGGVLRPTLNYASAKLIQGSDSTVQVVSRASLIDAPRGAPVGIPDAPQTLPTTGELVGSHWLTCVPNPGGAASPQQLRLDFDPLTQAAPMTPDRYAQVRSADGATFLLWQGNKHRVSEPKVAAALGLPQTAPVAPASWLDAVPEGEPIAPAEVPGAGTPGPAVGGHSYPVGQLFEERATDGTPRLTMLGPDGLMPVSITEFTLQAARAGTAEPVRIGPAEIASTPRSRDRSLATRFDGLAGARGVDGDETACLRQEPGEGPQVRSELVLATPHAAASPRTTAALPIASGVLAASVPIPAGQRTPERYLISDQGIKYPLPDNESMQALGFGGAPVRPVPGELLAGLPTGPVLGRAAAGASEKG